MKLSLGVHQSRVFSAYDNECLCFRERSRSFHGCQPHGGPVADTPGMLQGPQQTWEGGSARGKWVVLFQIPWLLILFPFFWIVVTFLWTFKCSILGNIFFQGIRSFSSFWYFFSAQTVYIFFGGGRIEFWFYVSVLSTFSKWCSGDVYLIYV